MSESTSPPSDRDLLRRIGRSAGQKAGYKQLVRELGLGGGRERRLLIEQLTRMVAKGELFQPSTDMWAVPAPPPDKAADHHQPGSRFQGFENVVRAARDRLIAGRLDLHRDGFGFVRVDGTPGARPAEDIFIPPNEINGAMQGDQVLVDEAPPGRAVNGIARRSGRIARVLTRRNPTVVGIFHYGDSAPTRERGSSEHTARTGSGKLVHGNYVTPMDERVASLIAIADGLEIVTAPAQTPNRTLSDEARRRILRDPLEPAAEEGAAPRSFRRAPARPLEGLAVDVEIIDFPSAGRPARGRVIEVLGPPDAFGVDVEIVIRKHHLPHVFSPAVLAEAEAQATHTVATLLPTDLADREDFRHLPPPLAIVTIDGETARDFDDAVLVRPLPNGHTELQVHIADVSHYVRPGTALDTEARVRGTSVYFPDRAVPMLPHALSSGMCSLLPNQDRLVLSCIMDIDPEGEIAGFRLAEGIIRSAHRLTYTAVQAALDQGPGPRAQGPEPSPGVPSSPQTPGAPSSPQTPGVPSSPQTPGAPSSPQTPGAPSSPQPPGAPSSPQPPGAPSSPTVSSSARVGTTSPDPSPSEPWALNPGPSPPLPDFHQMYRLALLLNAKRHRRGSIDFDLPEPVVQFDPEGNMRAIVRSERGWAHRLIEEFMLSANECVATWLGDLGIPSIYRIHEMPDPKRIVDFEETAAGFGHSLGIGNLPVRKLTMKSDRRDVQRNGARGRNTRAPQTHEVPASIPITPQMYQKLVSRIQGTPEERILAYLMLRSLKQARYSERNDGHFALASPSYTHFTSPIRRYPDLIVHRLIRAMLQAGANPQGGPITSTDPQPWQTNLDRSRGKGPGPRPQGAESLGAPSSPTVLSSVRVGSTAASLPGAPSSPTASSSVRVGPAQDRHSLVPDPSPLIPPLAPQELQDIATESSQAERRAADAERELMEWKKIKFMQDRIGDDFHATILSVTKFGFFVELDDLFIEGLVPLSSLVGDFYTFRDTDRSICGARTGHCFALGQRVQVLLDRIDRQQRRLQFALLPGTEPTGTASLRSPEPRRNEHPDNPCPAKPTKRSGKSKTRQRNKKTKGKR